MTVDWSEGIGGWEGETGKVGQLGFYSPYMYTVVYQIHLRCGRDLKLATGRTDRTLTAGLVLDDWGRTGRAVRGLGVPAHPFQNPEPQCSQSAQCSRVGERWHSIVSAAPL